MGNLLSRRPTQAAAHGAPPAAAATGESRATSTATEADAEHWRAEADRHAKQRNECFEHSKQAYAKGDGAQAKELSNQGKEHDRLMKEANEKAAAAAFAAKNARVGDDEIDLHGLQVSEALERTRQRIESCLKTGQTRLVIIHGKGSHSVDGIAKIKPAVQAMLVDYKTRISYELDTPNEGCITVHFAVPGSAPPPAHARPCAIL